MTIILSIFSWIFWFTNALFCYVNLIYWRVFHFTTFVIYKICKWTFIIPPVLIYSYSHWKLLCHLEFLNIFMFKFFFGTVFLSFFPQMWMVLFNVSVVSYGNRFLIVPEIPVCKLTLCGSFIFHELFLTMLFHGCSE